MALSLPVTTPSMESHFLRACQESGREELTPRLGGEEVSLLAHFLQVGSPLHVSAVHGGIHLSCYFLPSSAGPWLRDDSNWCGSHLVPCGWPRMWWGGFTMALFCDTVPLGLWEVCPLGKILFLPVSYCA